MNGEKPNLHTSGEWNFQSKRVTEHHRCRIRGLQLGRRSWWSGCRTCHIRHRCAPVRPAHLPTRDRSHHLSASNLNSILRFDWFIKLKAMQWNLQLVAGLFSSTICKNCHWHFPYLNGIELMAVVTAGRSSSTPLFLYWPDLFLINLWNWGFTLLGLPFRPGQGLIG